MASSGGGKLKVFTKEGDGGVWDDGARPKTSSDSSSSVRGGGAGPSAGTSLLQQPASDAISDDEPDNFGQIAERTLRIHGVEAAKLAFFFEQDMVDLSQKFNARIEKVPPFGQVKEVMVKCTSRMHYDKISEGLKAVRKKTKELSEEELDVDPEQFQTVEGHVKEKVNDKRVLVVFDAESKRRVWIISRQYNIMKETLHSIKMALGLVKPTGRSRAGRKLDTGSTDSTSFNQSSSGISRLDGQSMSSSVDSRRNRGGGAARGWEQEERGGTDESWERSEFKFEFMLPGGLLVKVYKGSITRLKVDAIVNAANDNLMHGGGVARVIAKAAGYQFQAESSEYINKYGLIKVSENCVTSAGDLPYKGVIHAVGPQWYLYSRRAECLDALYKTIINLLKTSNKEEYRSVAMPAISAGIYGVPKELCANMYIKAAVDFDLDLSRGDYSYPCEFHIIDVDVTILQMVKDSYRNWQRDSYCLDPSRCLSDFQKANPTHQYSSGTGATWSSAGRHGNKKNDNTKQSKPMAIYDVKYLGSTTLSYTGSSSENFMVGQLRRVSVYEGSVAKVRSMDAVVVGIDSRLTDTGFIGNALRTAGGLSYQEAFRKMVDKKRYGSVSEGDVLKCKGGSLGVRLVLFLVLKRFISADKKELQDYKKGIGNVLKKAAELGVQKIAIPLLGTGGIETDKQKLGLVCETVLEAIDHFCSKTKYDNPTEIHLVNNRRDTSAALASVFRRAADMRGGPSPMDTSPPPAAAMSGVQGSAALGYGVSGKPRTDFHRSLSSSARARPSSDGNESSGRKSPNVEFDNFSESRGGYGIPDGAEIDARKGTGHGGSERSRDTMETSSPPQTGKPPGPLVRQNSQPSTLITQDPDWSIVS